MRQDVVVVGAGLAGLAAAVRLAEAGRRVLVLAKGAGSTHLTSGTIDVLGYTPERVEHPGAALAGLPPEHPYALLGADAVAAALGWFQGRFDGAYRYVGGLEENLLLPTAAGAAKPSALVPVTMAGGDLRRPEPICVVGFRALRDFHPAYVADNLGAGGVPARALELDLEIGGRPDENALGLARRFDDPVFRATVAARLAGRLEAGERVGFPAALGLRDPAVAWRELQERLGRPVFEIPTLPPSVPGLRGFRVLEHALRRAGGRIVMGAEVLGFDGAAVRARAAARDVLHPTDWVVLASGGFAAGGLALDSRWRARETVLGLPLAGLPVPGAPRFVPNYFGAQPMARAGVRVDAELRPLDAQGDRVRDDVLVAGATLAGAVPWREGSGDGISLTSGHRAAELILAATPARAAVVAAP